MDRTSNPHRKTPRLHLNTTLAAENMIELDRARSHYLFDVMRMKVGDKVRLFNGRNGEWLAGIVEAGRKSCQLEATEQLRPQEEEPGPTLLFAPIKKARMEMLVEKATELGVSKLMPVKTRRSIVDRVNVERLRAIAVEAAEQCERLTVPDIRELQTLEQALEDRPASAPLYVADETGAGNPLQQALAPDRPATFLIGPEGGFDPAELERLDALPAVVKVDLGPRILRAETAGMVSLATWLTFSRSMCF
ncbi:MAG: 16S rRNA (uracil(1498)-N(3))-methyltransferase [Geminicoccaceae bacterium]